MPRPRFNKLDPAKRQRILEAAAQQFAAHGYDHASLNQILADAGISKGAAYYYFDDKADLYTTAVQHYASALMDDLPQTLPLLTAQTFWPMLKAMYADQFAALQERPWVLGLVKSAGRLTPEQIAETGLAETFGQLRDLLGRMIEQGQELGVMRTDLPADLLLNIFMSVDDALDQWLLANWSQLTPEEIEPISGKVLDGMQRLLSAANDSPAA